MWLEEIQNSALRSIYRRPILSHKIYRSYIEIVSYYDLEVRCLEQLVVAAVAVAAVAAVVAVVVVVVVAAVAVDGASILM